VSESVCGTVDLPVPAALAANRSYKLLGDPSQVDLSLEISLTSFGITYLNSAPSGYPQDPIAMFRLKIYDSANHKLWTMTQPVDFALLQKNRDHNFDDAITALLLQFLQVAGKAPTSAAPAAAMATKIRPLRTSADFSAKRLNIIDLLNLHSEFAPALRNFPTTLRTAGAQKSSAGHHMVVTASIFIGPILK